MAWRLTIRHSTRPAETRTFDSPREAWQAVHKLVGVLEADGFVAGEVEVVSYGRAWIQRASHANGETCSLLVEAIA